MNSAIARRIFLLVSSCLVISCASYQSQVNNARDLIKKGEFAKACDKLKPMAEKPGDDQLVYLFDYGTALQLAGRYEESNKALELADKLSEVQDYTSLSREAGS